MPAFRQRGHEQRRNIGVGRLRLDPPAGLETVQARHHRIDMHTLTQEHDSVALTGAPPGYVGSKEDGSLFNSELIQGTYSCPGIVLFDELEKASRDVVRSLLGSLENGQLTLAGLQ